MPSAATSSIGSTGRSPSPRRPTAARSTASPAAASTHGTPTIVYTSIGPKTPADDNAVQWLATSTDGMRTWRKHPANPVMTLALHGDLKIKDWRDPFVWKDGDDWFAVLGGHRAGGNGCALIYKSKDLVHWQFLNVLMEGTEKNWECPNFFKLGDKWVLIYSPHGPVRYYTGTLTKDYKFVPEYHGTLDESHDFLRPDIGARPGRPRESSGAGPGSKATAGTAA